MPVTGLPHPGAPSSWRNVDFDWDPKGRLYSVAVVMSRDGTTENNFYGKLLFARWSDAVWPDVEETVELCPSRVSHASLCVTADGTVHVAYVRLPAVAGGARSLPIHRWSEDGGRTWSPETSITLPAVTTTDRGQIGALRGDVLPSFEAITGDPWSFYAKAYRFDGERRGEVGTQIIDLGHLNIAAEVDFSTGFGIEVQFVPESAEGGRAHDEMLACLWTGSDDVTQNVARLYISQGDVLTAEVTDGSGEVVQVKDDTQLTQLEPYIARLEVLEVEGVTLLRLRKDGELRGETEITSLPAEIHPRVRFVLGRLSPRLDGPGVEGDAGHPYPFNGWISLTTIYPNSFDPSSDKPANYPDHNGPSQSSTGMLSSGGWRVDHPSWELLNQHSLQGLSGAILTRRPGSPQELVLLLDGILLENRWDETDAGSDGTFITVRTRQADGTFAWSAPQAIHTGTGDYLEAAYDWAGFHEAQAWPDGSLRLKWHWLTGLDRYGYYTPVVKVLRGGGDGLRVNNGLAPPDSVDAHPRLKLLVQMAPYNSAELYSNWKWDCFRLEGQTASGYPTLGGWVASSAGSQPPGYGDPGVGIGIMSYRPGGWDYDPENFAGQRPSPAMPDVATELVLRARFHPGTGQLWLLHATFPDGNLRFVRCQRLGQDGAIYARDWAAEDPLHLGDQPAEFWITTP